MSMPAVKDASDVVITKGASVEVLVSPVHLIKLGGYAFCEKGQTGKVKSIPNAKNVQVVFPGREKQPIGFEPEHLKVIPSP